MKITPRRWRGIIPLDSNTPAKRSLASNLTRFGLFGLVLVGLIAGAMSWTSGDKTLNLRVDGENRTLHTSAATVASALRAAHIEVGSHDLVAPDLTSRLRDKATIVVSKGHLLHLTVDDGTNRDVWVNASTVEEALTQLGYGKGGTSVSRSRRLDAGATDIAIRLPKYLEVHVDGSIRVVESSSATIADALQDAGITLGPDDRVSVPTTTALSQGLTLTIQRVTYGASEGDVPVAFGVTEQPDPSQTVGQRTVVSKGTNGLSHATYRLIYVDGVLEQQVVVTSTVKTAPVAEVDKVGTAPKPVPTVLPVSQVQAYAQSFMLATYGWGNDQFSCLVLLFNRESGWNALSSNSSSGAYGIPQALPGSKMASAGADWQTNGETQVRWGLGYIAGRYGTPCGAWAHSQSTGWY